MRKINICFLFIPLLISACDISEYYYYTVKNESAKTVSFIFNDSLNIETIAPANLKEFQTKTGQRFTGINNIDAGSPYGFGFSVLMESKTTSTGINYTFKNNNPFDLHVTNTLPVNVIIKADDFIDNEGQPTITINANSSNNTAKIYTKNPVFSLTSEPYPVIFNWNFENNTIYLIIR